MHRRFFLVLAADHVSKKSTAVKEATRKQPESSQSCGTTMYDTSSFFTERVVNARSLLQPSYQSPANAV
jgi:hypothetical protein